MRKHPVNPIRVNPPADRKPGFNAQVKTKAKRKLMAQQSTTPGIWLGLGMMGLIGWSIVIPTLLGTAIGLWLDKQGAGEHSWTLALLIAGLILGCCNAWYWVAKEEKAIHKVRDDDE